MSPAKIEACCVIRNELNEIAKINPMYFCAVAGEHGECDPVHGIPALAGFLRTDRLGSGDPDLPRTFENCSAVHVCLSDSEPMVIGLLS